MLAGAHTDTMREALRALAGLASAEQFGRHVDALQDGPRSAGQARSAWPDLAAAQRRALGVTGDSETRDPSPPR